MSGILYPLKSLGRLGYLGHRLSERAGKGFREARQGFRETCLDLGVDEVRRIVLTRSPRRLPSGATTKANLAARLASDNRADISHLPTYFSGGVNETHQLIMTHAQRIKPGELTGRRTAMQGWTVSGYLADILPPFEVKPKNLFPDRLTRVDIRLLVDPYGEVHAEVITSNLDKHLGLPLLDRCKDVFRDTGIDHMFVKVPPAIMPSRDNFHVEARRFPLASALLRKSGVTWAPHTYSYDNANIIRDIARKYAQEESAQSVMAMARNLGGVPVDKWPDRKSAFTRWVIAKNCPVWLQVPVN